MLNALNIHASTPPRRYQQDLAMTLKAQSTRCQLVSRADHSLRLAVGSCASAGPAWGSEAPSPEVRFAMELAVSTFMTLPLSSTYFATASLRAGSPGNATRQPDGRVAVRRDIETLPEAPVFVFFKVTVSRPVFESVLTSKSYFKLSRGCDFVWSSLLSDIV